MENQETKKDNKFKEGLKKAGKCGLGMTVGVVNKARKFVTETGNKVVGYFEKSGEEVITDTKNVISKCKKNKESEQK